MNGVQLPLLVNFEIQRGDSFAQAVHLVQNPIQYVSAQFDFASVANSDRIDLTNVYAEFIIRSGNRILLKRTNNGVGGITCEKGRFVIEIPAEKTAAIKPNKYQYEFKIRIGKETTSFLKGDLRITQDEDILPESATILCDWTHGYLLPKSSGSPAAPIPIVPSALPPFGSFMGGYATLFYETPDKRYFRVGLNRQFSMVWVEDNPKKYPDAFIIRAID
jgi:hypothetical protein